MWPILRDGDPYLSAPIGCPKGERDLQRLLARTYVAIFGPMPAVMASAARDALAAGKTPSF